MAVRIGILGEIRAGKDSVARIIEDYLEEDPTAEIGKVAFSNGIHDVIKMIMPETYEGGKPRALLQQLGQFLRGFKEDVWIDYLLNSSQYKQLEESNGHIIVTDVRQPNEARRLQEQGYVLIKVTADKEIRLQRALAEGDNFDPAMLEHETELVVHKCPYDFEIDNSGSVEDLQVAVINMLDKLVEGK